MISPSKEHIGHILIFEFNKKSPVEDAHKAITNTYGERVIGLGTCQKWYYKFHNGNFDISGKPKSGRKVKFNTQRLIDVITRDSIQSIHKLEKALDAKSSTIGRHLKRLVFIHRYWHWIRKPVRKKDKVQETSDEEEQLLNEENQQSHSQILIDPLLINRSLPLKNCNNPNWFPNPIYLLSLVIIYYQIK